MSRITAQLKARGGMHHTVELDPKASAGTVTIDVLRPARDAKSNQQLHLTSTQARELMKRLQSRADEADRLAYQAEKLRLEQARRDLGLDPVVAELVKKGIR